MSIKATVEPFNILVSWRQFVPAEVIKYYKEKSSSMLAYIVLVAVLPAVIMGYPIVPCGDGLPTPTEFRIQNCTSSPCSFQRGTVIAYQIDFTTNEASDTLLLRADMTALGETIDFPIPAPIANVCNWLVDRNCPVTPGLQVTKSSAIPLITDLHGGIPATVRMRIYNASGTPAVCAILQLRIY